MKNDCCMDSMDGDNSRQGVTETPHEFFRSNITIWNVKWVALPIIWQDYEWFNFWYYNICTYVCTYNLMRKKNYIRIKRPKSFGEKGHEGLAGNNSKK